MYKTPGDLTEAARDLARETHRLATIVEQLTKRDISLGHPWRHLIYSFLGGLSVFLGSTVGVALLIWLLRQLGYLPLLGELFQRLQGSIGG